MIAFGAANVSAVGNGYATAPLKRLRHRLQRVHGCHVTLIGEHNTSKLLAREGTTLQKPYKKLDQVTEEEFESGSWKSNPKYHLWGVRYTTVYKKGKLGHRIYVNRDVNAAINIADIYCTLAVTGERPERHSPLKESVEVGMEVVTGAQVNFDEVQGEGEAQGEDGQGEAQGEDGQGEDQGEDQVAKKPRTSPRRR